MRILLLVLLTLLLQSCDESKLNCDGQVIVENEIPEVTLELGGEPFSRNVFEEPVVFRHTAGLHISITPTSDNTLIVKTSVVASSIVEVHARKIGFTKVKITAIDECLEDEWSTSFEVTVVDSSQL